MVQFYQDRMGYFKQYYEMNKEKIKKRSRKQYDEVLLRKMTGDYPSKKYYISYQDLMKGYKPPNKTKENKISRPIVKKYCGVIEFDF